MDKEVRRILDSLEALKNHPVNDMCAISRAMDLIEEMDRATHEIVESWRKSRMIMAYSRSNN